MLKLRNLSLMRRIYVWMLNTMARVAYWGNLGDHPPPARAIEQRRIRRINSELECGPAAWKNSFLAVSADVSSTRESQKDLAFRLTDLTPYVAEGVEAIVGDTLTRCFTADAREPWNFLTRTAPAAPRELNPYWTFLWLIGIWTRYCVLLPLRAVVLILGILCFIIGFTATFCLPKGSNFQIRVRKWMLRFLASSVVASWSGYVRYHGNRPQPRANQIYVANHTSLVDVFMLVKDYNFSFIGQRHGGLAGMLQDLLHTAQDHVWFDREEGRDRRSVHHLLKEHVSDGRKEPMLVFPEGTCTNSDYCIMFKKGAFELDATVYPIALKYKKRFGDPFWNSQTTSFPRHLYELMTSWALVCDVHYLDPMQIRDGETSIQFANRVRNVICDRAGLICVNWDGFLKRHRISPKFMQQRQTALAQIVQRRLNGEMPRAASSSLLSTTLPGGAQTHQVVTGGVDMDTLSLQKLLPEQERAGYVASSKEEESISRDKRSTLRRRTNGVNRDAEDVHSGTGNRRTRLLSRAGVAARDVTKWVIGLVLFAVASTITWRLMPTSWVQFLFPR